VTSPSEPKTYGAIPMTFPARSRTYIPTPDLELCTHWSLPNVHGPSMVPQEVNMNCQVSARLMLNTKLLRCVGPKRAWSRRQALCREHFQHRMDSNPARAPIQTCLVNPEIGTLASFSEP
jgi:hypothetical protein